MVDVRQLTALEARAFAPALADVLSDCVAGGASVSFMAPLTRETAEGFFEGVAEAVERGERILLAAFLHANLVGTVQVVTVMPPNQPHRAEIAKLLVARQARGLGIGTLLMQRAEDAARAAGKSLLVLDTASAAAENVYLNLGWTKLGVIPKFALLPDGGFCDTTLFWKWIA